MGKIPFQVIHTKVKVGYQKIQNCATELIDSYVKYPKRNFMSKYGL